jgi:hypothetical protein
METKIGAASTSQEKIENSIQDIRAGQMELKIDINDTEDKISAEISAIETKIYADQEELRHEISALPD